MTTSEMRLYFTSRKYARYSHLTKFNYCNDDLPIGRKNYKGATIRDMWFLTLRWRIVIGNSNNLIFDLRKENFVLLPERKKYVCDIIFIILSFVLKSFKFSFIFYYIDFVCSLFNQDQIFWRWNVYSSKTLTINKWYF